MKIINPDSIDLSNPEFQLALQFVQETNQSFFLTGKAGTGKSTFLKYIIANVRKNFVVVAPTGIAAVNVGGETIHSFFQFPLRPLLPEDEDIKIFWEGSEKREIIEELDTLFIDEVSMVRADLVDGIDYSLRKNGGNPNLPFGGKQVVFVGDVFQLEPVTKKDSGEYAIINDIYKSPYFFNAKVFEQIVLPPIELLKVYRQATDLEFVNLLDKVRVKNIAEKDIQKINNRVFPHEEIEQHDLAINLTTRNDMADRVNRRELNKLETEEFIYKAEISGTFEESKYPTEPELKLKVGAQVIILKNDPEKRWVNGTIAKIAELHDSYVKVELKNKQVYEVEKRVWENVKFQYNKEKRKIEEEVIGTFKQYPLNLAWAINIHKSQGMTFDKTVVDFGSGAFAAGQAYVALSRVTTFEGLFLKRRIFSNDILVDAEVKEFAKTYNDKALTKDILKKCRLDFFKDKSNRFDSNGNRIKRKRIKKIDVIQISDLEVKIDNQILITKNLDVDCFLNEAIKKFYETEFDNSIPGDFDILKYTFSCPSCGSRKHSLLAETTPVWHKGDGSRWYELVSCNECGEIWTFRNWEPSFLWENEDELPFLKNEEWRRKT